MKDYIRRFLIAGVMALCVGLLFLGGKTIKAAENDTAAGTDHWIWPANGVITDTFGTRNGKHKGIDIAGEHGEAVYAVKNGVVSKSYYSDSYGNVIFIRHDNDTETVYAHLLDRLVAEGDELHQGDRIGSMGSTGHSSGVHLHFEIHKNEWTYDKNNAVDPALAYDNETIGEAVEVDGRQKAAAKVSALPSDDDDHTDVSYSGDGAVQQAEEQKHVVKKGETLWSIAKQYGTTVSNLMDINGLTSDSISVNETIEVGKADHYIVQPGDTLSAIARKHHVTVPELLQLNDLSTDVINPEQKIIIQKN